MTAAVMSLTGCATVYNEAIGRKEMTFFSAKQEIDIGNSVDKQIRSRYKVSGNALMQARLKAVGDTLAEVSDRQAVPYSFTVVESEAINAFTIPGGHIYATEALMKAVGNNHELASVIAHEIGHVAARHPIKRLEAAYGYTFLSQVAFAFMQPETNAELNRLRQIQRMTNTVYRLIELGYGRKDELTADSLGLRYMRRAGYNPYAMAAFMEKLAENEPDMPEWTVFIKSHPHMKDRIAAVKEELAMQEARAQAAP